MSINQFAIEGHMPDYTIFLDIDAETGLERIQKGRTYLDRLDQEKLSFHMDVWNGYREIIERYKDRMILIDASKSVEEVTEAAYLAVKQILDEA